MPGPGSGDDARIEAARLQARIEAAQQAAADALAEAENWQAAATAATDQALACHRDAVAILAGIACCSCCHVDCPECRHFYGGTHRR